MQYDQPVKSKDPLNRSGPVQLQADWACTVRAQGAVCTMSIKNQGARRSHPCGVRKVLQLSGLLGRIRIFYSRIRRIRIIIFLKPRNQNISQRLSTPTTQALHKQLNCPPNQVTILFHGRVGLSHYPH